MGLRLVEKSLVKNYANIATADLYQESQILGMIEQASQEVQDITKRQFAFGTYTEYYQSYDQVFTDPTPQFVWVDAFPIVTTDPNPQQITGETPVGAVDGSNTIFTPANTPLPTSSLKVYLDGTPQNESTDYFVNQGASFFVFLTPPNIGQAVTVDYLRSNPNIGPPVIIWAPNEMHDSIGVTLSATDYQIVPDQGCLIIRRAAGLASGALLPLYLGNLIFAYAPRGFKVTYTGGFQATVPPSNWDQDPLDDYGVTQVPQGLKNIIAVKVSQDITAKRRVLSPWTLEEQKSLHPYRKRDIGV